MSRWLAGPRAGWALAMNDLRAWLRSPWAVAAALVPPLGMGVLVAVLTLAVSKQPVALVVEDRGLDAERMAQIVRGDREAYALKDMSLTQAEAALRQLQVAAIIRIPDGFGAAAATGDAHVDLLLNNIDVDFSDDLRRTVTRSVAQFDAPELGGEAGVKDSLLQAAVRQLAHPETAGQALTATGNPYRVAVDEHDLRFTTVSFMRYQVVPILILAAVNIGLLGTALLCVREFEERTIKVLLLAPVRRGFLLGGKLCAGVLASAALLTLLVFGGVWRGALRPPAAHWPALIALLGGTAVMAAGLGVLLGTLVRRSRVLTVVGLNLATALFFLGGGFTTVAFLPDWLAAIARILPTSYAIDGLRQTLFYPDLRGVGRDLLVLGAAAIGSAVLSALALRRGWNGR